MNECYYVKSYGPGTMVYDNYEDAKKMFDVLIKLGAHDYLKLEWKYGTIEYRSIINPEDIIYDVTEDQIFNEFKKEEP